MQNQGANSKADESVDIANMTEEQIQGDFDKMYNSDPRLRQMLGDYLDDFSSEEKFQIVQAYNKGGI